MRRRMIQMLVLVVLFVAAIGLVKFFQIRAAIAGFKSFQQPPEAVTTMIAQRQQWQTTIDAVGSVAPIRGVTLSADMPGVVDQILFESGAHVEAGQALVTLDTRQERAQLASAEAQRDLAKTNLDRGKKLLDQQLLAQSDYDQLAALEKQAEASVNEMRAGVERKTIRAPFAGIAGIRQVNVGQYLHSGDPVVPLQAVTQVYVDFSVPQQQVALLHAGDAVTTTLTASGEHLTGRITAINPVVDDATRNVQVQATFDNSRGLLRAGMYLTLRVGLGTHEPVIAVPASSINYAPYGNSVFIVEDIKGEDGKSYRGVRQQFVKLGEAIGDMVAIVDGVKPGQEVVTSGVFKLRAGAAVLVNNKVLPSASTSPKPEDS
ncbi:MAG TPA: efflux RND transporter periplasmic adaptor subunit [Candidatus Acidoferrales bacterium]|nr:efflux RND transporter periplasmic adaptor subunit [Candidatus Acidoferrales bacterium]